MKELMIKENRNYCQIKSQNAYTSHATFTFEDGHEESGELMTSYRTPVACQIGFTWYFSPISYSVTTSKQITQYTGMDSKERKQYLKDHPDRAVSFVQ